MLKVDARGDACPLPVVKAKKAISELKGAAEPDQDGPAEGLSVQC